MALFVCDDLIIGTDSGVPIVSAIYFLTLRQIIFHLASDDKPIRKVAASQLKGPYKLALFFHF